MAQHSRLRIDPTTLQPSIQSFGELSNFLRGSIADEDSRLFSESMGQLASSVEGIILVLRADRSRARAAPLLVDLLTTLRAHRNFVVALPPVWRGLYEYAGYLQALNNFRVLIGQWLLDGGPHSAQLALTAEDFELVAWRALGEGLLLIDMYEQWAAGRMQEPPDSGLAALEQPHVERALQWWKKLRL